MSTSQTEIFYNYLMENFLKLKEVREEFGYTQKQVAEYLCVRQNTYSQYESYKREIPLTLLIKLADLYDVSVDYLLGRE